ncbi:MAG TPA: phosphoenolpyruvate--protein phosphotransferase [Steroidobacteraceae bacterium]|nr:phosphoenolpyruvate--protein phosphotransferase [Steroidobacteraceae bacterium]
MPLIIRAPFAGWCAPLSEIPDAAFAQGLLGDGVGLDPTGNELRSPCDGEVISVAASRHALALRTAAGAEILVHVGVDTVGLAGEGFNVHVRKGDRVHAGDLLITFDLDLLARKAPSLMTPVIVTNADRFRIAQANTRRKVASGDALFEIEQFAAGESGDTGEPAVSGAVVVSESVVVDHAHGIHARPAAQIARIAKGLPFEIELRARGRGARARSTVALMSLGIRGGDEVVIVGFEPAAAVGIAAIVKAIRQLERVAPSAAVAPVAAAPVGDTSQLRGVIASPGLGVGTAFYLHAAELPVTEAGRGVQQESTDFERARDAVRARLSRLATTAAPTLREIMSAHLELLDDPDLVDGARAAIAGGKSAGFAWRESLHVSARALSATGDARLAERVDDLRDLERQLLLALDGAQAPSFVIPPEGILLARDLTPSQLVDIDASKLAGIALAAGGPTSHVAILAATLGVPMLVAMGPSLLEVSSGSKVILDADAGIMRADPDAQTLAETRRRLERGRALREQQTAAAQVDCHLASGERIEVFANLTGSEADATLAAAQGAEGCGLLRTEFLFLERETAPDEEEQLRCYSQVARILGTRPLIIRTLDIGGDKPIPYLPLPPEDNPALGLRGVRTSLWRPDLLEVQLRAMLRVQPAGVVRILLPMITDVAEIRAVRRLLDEACARLEVSPPVLGAMIETPAAAVLADAIAREVDFLSIGTNDLAQYTLAMDRGHAELAARIDGVHPAVLRMIDITCRGAAASGKPVAVCGGLAADPSAVPVLLGLGVSELSVVPTLIPQLKAQVRALTLEACRATAARALALESAAQVRAL